jgi:spoIIIJ-associated protein
MENQEKNNGTDKQEFTGRNLEDTISHAEHVLKIPRSQFNYEIVAEKTKLFGIKTKEIVIRAWPKTASDEDPALRFLDSLLEQYPLDIQYNTRRNHDILFIIFEGRDKTLLLQKDGALLLAFQHVLNKISPLKVQTDCDFFRKRKERELKEYVRHVARRVRQSGRKEMLDPMNPYERRLVHIAVNQIPGIATESIGEGFLKKVKVYPTKGQKSKPYS